jgi:hypothetical protein
MRFFVAKALLRMTANGGLDDDSGVIVTINPLRGARTRNGGATAFEAGPSLRFGMTNFFVNYTTTDSRGRRGLALAGRVG